MHPHGGACHLVMLGYSKHIITNDAPAPVTIAPVQPAPLTNALKVTVHPKIKILSSLLTTHVVPNPYFRYKERFLYIKSKW